MWIKAAGLILGVAACFGLGVLLFLASHPAKSREDAVREEPAGEREVSGETPGGEPAGQPEGTVSGETDRKPQEPEQEEAAVLTGEEIVQMEDSFYTYEQMSEDLEVLGSLFSGLVYVESLGLTADGREIPEVVLGDPKAQTHLLIQASIHGREYMNTQILMKQLENFLRNYETGVYREKSYSELLNGLCLHLIPMANPDGVTISQMGPEGIRTEACREFLQQCYEMDQADGREMSDYWRSWKANARGVDLNRNFDVGWEAYAGCGHPSSEMYKGESPASEAEVQAILKIQEEFPLAGCMAYHSSGNVIYWDYQSEGELYEQDLLLAQTVCEVTGYELRSTVSDGTDLAGCSDYFVMELGIPAVTIENGSGSCPLSAEELPELMRRNADLIPAYLNLYQK